jgi:hypothetical protein
MDVELGECEKKQIKKEERMKYLLCDYTSLSRLAKLDIYFRVQEM